MAADVQLASAMRWLILLVLARTAYADAPHTTFGVSTHALLISHTSVEVEAAHQIASFVYVDGSAIVRGSVLGDGGDDREGRVYGGRAGLSVVAWGRLAAVGLRTTTGYLVRRGTRYDGLIEDGAIRFTDTGPVFAQQLFARLRLGRYVALDVSFTVMHMLDDGWDLMAGAGVGIHVTL